MNKTLLVLKNELISVISRRSYIIILFLVPAVSALVMIVVSVLGSDTSKVVGQVFNPPSSSRVSEGYVDPGGIVSSLSPGTPKDRFTAFPDVAAARAALEAGKISGFYVVPTDFIETGKLTYVRVDFNPLAGLEQTHAFEALLQYNLLNGDQQLYIRFQQPLKLDVVSLGNQPQRDSGNGLTFLLPYLVTMIFYVMILSASGLMLSSVTTEKQNRVIEMLLVSVTPLQLLAGKIVALGAAGLFQTLVWSGAGLLLMRVSGSTLGISAAFQLPVTILAWGGLFFLLGYGVYASLMAGVGALVPNLREGSQATTIMIIPLVIPLVFLSALIQEPNGTLAVALSLFPLTAPVTMMTRLSAGVVPVWQIALSAGLLVATVALILRAVAGMFRAQALLSGQAFNLKRFARALTGKAA